MPADVARLADTVSLLHVQMRVLAGMATATEAEALAALLERR